MTFYCFITKPESPPLAGFPAMAHRQRLLYTVATVAIAAEWLHVRD